MLTYALQANPSFLHYELAKSEPEELLGAVVSVLSLFALLVLKHKY